MRNALTTTVLAAAILSTAVAAQVRDQKPALAQQTAGKGVIAGVVVAADTGRPVRRARVVLTGGVPRVSRSAQSDDVGAFRFDTLPAGQFTLTSNKGGFIETIYGQKQPGSGRPGTPIQLSAGQELTQISMPIARGGVITGLVFEETGEPAFGASIRAYRWITKTGERTLTPVGNASTDDRGMYRIPGLQPGSYVVTATGRAGEFEVGVEGVAYFKVMEAMNNDFQLAIAADRLVLDKTGYAADAPNVPRTGFATLYYPNTTQAASAATIPLGISEERSGIDFQMQVVPLGRVGGMILGAEGPVRGANVQLVDQEQIPGVGTRSTRTGPDGRFTFNGVPPGQYTVIARAAAKGSPALEGGSREAIAFLASDELAQNAKRRAELAATIAKAAPLWGASEVGFDGRDQTEISITLQPGLTVSGKVEFEAGPGAAPDPTRMSVTVTPAGQNRLSGEAGLPTPGPVDANGNFIVRGVLPGRYTISIAAGNPAGYSIKSAIFGGIDALDQPLDVTGAQPVAGGVVTMSTKTTEVTGLVQDATGQPLPGVTVIAFSAEDRFWTPNSRRIQGVRPATDGRYTFKNLPPGDYRIVAVLDVETGQWFDPAFLRSLSGFVMLNVTEGGKHTMDLRAR